MTAATSPSVVCLVNHMLVFSVLSCTSLCVHNQHGSLRPPLTGIVGNDPCCVNRKSSIGFNLSDPCVARSSSGMSDVAIAVCCQACDQIERRQPDAGRSGLELDVEVDVWLDV